MKKTKIVGRIGLSAMLMLLLMTLPASALMTWTTLEDFEGYADTTDMNANAPLYMWTADGGVAEYHLDSAGGNQSVLCKLNPAGWGYWNVFGLRYYDGSGIDLSSYDALSMTLKGNSALSGNANVTAMKLQVADAYGTLLVDQALDLSWATSDDWNTVEVAIDDTWSWSEVRWIGLRLQRGQYHKPEFYLDDFKVGVVPEPASMAILGLGVGVMALRRKKTK